MAGLDDTCIDWWVPHESNALFDHYHKVSIKDGAYVEDKLT